MIVKKLLAPLVNNKILQEAEYCYVASSALSEITFDLLMSKLHPKCHVDIVTGLDYPTHPNVLWKAFKQYPDRVTLKIHTKNTFHAQTYIFDMPFRKRVAFIGSGDFTLGGIKDNEELFYKIDVEKSVEELKSWFRSYFEYGQDLKEKMISEYELIYASMVERENASREDVLQLKDFITGRFRWEAFNFTNQYFKLEDYLTFENRKAPLDDQLVYTERLQVQNKLIELHHKLKLYLNKQKVYEDYNEEHIVSSLYPIYHKEHKVKSIWLSYGRSKRELEAAKAKFKDMMLLQVILRQYDLAAVLMVGDEYKGLADRAYFKSEMKKEEYRNKFFELIKKLGTPYWIKVAGDTRAVDSFSDENILSEFTNADNEAYSFIIGRTFSPGDPALSEDTIVSAINGEFDKLLPVYNWIKEKSME